jgi:hypothetical protein
MSMILRFTASALCLASSKNFLIECISASRVLLDCSWGSRVINRLLSNVELAESGFEHFAQPVATLPMRPPARYRGHFVITASRYN